MTVYPNAIDTDSDIVRIDDNVSELAGLAINQLRSSVFSIETTLGVNPQGSLSSVSEFLSVSHNQNGTIKASALTSVGLATLPIVNNQVASNAAIAESKLDLDFSTSDLHTVIVANEAVLNSLASFAAATNADLLTHISGGAILSDGSTLGRHVASHIDLNSVPSDSRDLSYVWPGLLDKNDAPRSATQVAEALLQINNDLVEHEIAIADAHVASAITVDTSNFVEISQEADTVQKALEAIDDSDVLLMGLHRAVQHSNGIPKEARSFVLTSPVADGYSVNVVPTTSAHAFLVHPPATTPQDNNTTGDDIIEFLNPDNTNFLFDSQFSQVKPGDIIRMDYGNGIEAAFIVESTRYIPGSEWIVRINGINVSDRDGYARIDRPLLDENTYGILAVAAANNDINSALMSSVIVGHPRAATALGLGFDANKLDSSHYNLYLQFYPSGNPADYVVDLPAIDVTGNAGVTPGIYTLDGVVQATNDAFRAAGYNYRFIAFSRNGEFGISIADAIDNASFSIVSGTLSGATLTTGSYTNNVIGDASDGLDGLGFGQALANFASPSYATSFSSALAAAFPTKLFMPLKRRDYVVDGIKRDDFKEMFLAPDGYWPATITNRALIGTTTVETTYLVDLDLCEAGLKSGKTLIVQPTIGFSDGSYNNADYGRFVIKEVNFTAACGDVGAQTSITVVNGVYASGNPIGASSGPPLAVNIYFSEDSVSFNSENVTDPAPSGTDYGRLHEIFINSSGHTFTHERARLPKQTETSDLLGTTDRWRITDVAPKLRGYKDDVSANVNKYVRFYVLGFDSTTGEFDGYIGKRVPGFPNIEKTGFPIRARKNVPTKFYDETNVDFIEISFNDDTVGGVDVMSSSQPRYVDIELFPSLRLDSEVFFLATCFLDLRTVKSIIDRREFGSIGPENFTDEAIDFISAADRALHENGVITGLIFEAVDSTDSGTLLFKGGMAIVNGSVVAINNGKVRIPQVREFGASLPATVDWAVCVNETGQFVPIILTTSKTQFFATSDGVNDYYLPSVSFAELITIRKDLTLIYVVTATINSITLSGFDARRFVSNEGSTIPFVWTGNLFEYTGHFRSLEQVRTWVNNLGLSNNKITVKGSFDVATALDFTGFTKDLILEGDMAEVNVTSAQGFIIGSNITIKNIKFNYNPDGIVYTVGDTINAGNGCIYSSTSVSDVVIKNCSFNTDIDGQIAPFINFDLSSTGTWNRISITDNKFLTTSATSQAIVAFTNSAAGDVVPSLARNIKIENNSATSTCGIYLTSSLSRPGLSCCSCVIEKNKCGVIGIMTSGVDTTLEFHPTSLVISENNCQLIANIALVGEFVNGVDMTYGTGDVWAINNRCCWISLACVNIPGLPADRGTLSIKGNHLSSQDNTFVSTNHGITPVTAIFVGGNSAISGGFADAVVTENTTDVGVINGTVYAYDIGIRTFIGGIISNNVIRGLSDGGGTSYGIRSSGLSQYISLQICDNQIYRSLGSNIYAFISGPASGDATVLVVDNFFDFPSVDLAVTDFVTVKDTTANWTVDRNKNQTVAFKLTDAAEPSGTTATHGVFGIKTSADDLTISGTSANTSRVVLSSGLASVFGGQVKFDYNDAGTEIMFNWLLSLETLLPPQAYVTAVGVTAVRSSGAAFSVTGNFKVTLVKNNGTIAGNTINLASVASGTSSLVTPDKSYIAAANQYLHLQITLDANSAAATQEVSITDVSVTYRY